MYYVWKEVLVYAHYELSIIIMDKEIVRKRFFSKLKFKKLK